MLENLLLSARDRRKISSHKNNIIHLQQQKLFRAVLEMKNEVQT